MSPRPPSKIHAPLPHSFDEVLHGIADEQRPVELSIQAKPFLKWVGGKRSILSELEARLPQQYTTYYEPFVGGGALYFDLQPEQAYISDINLHLIATYIAVRDDVETLIKYLKRHKKKHNKEYYLKARQRLNVEQDPTKLAALFIYLNKTCFNGLYRVNKSGGFNVPMGKYKDPKIADEETLRNCSTVLQGTKIYQHGYSHLPVEKGAFYYIDPPYHKTYSQYDGSGFGEQEHIELAAFCRKIDKAGGYFMVSNSDTGLVRSLYEGYTIENVQASRSVSCKANQRGKEYEVIIRNYSERKQGKQNRK